MIKLDDNYSLENNTIHGVELVFREKRKRINRKTQIEEDYIYEDKHYYANPILAIKKWIELTNNSTSITDLETFYENIELKLQDIYDIFTQNKRKLPVDG